MKPTIIITACAALLAASAGSSAQDTADKPRAFGNGVLPEHLAMYDVDDSGDLSLDEMEAVSADRASPDRHQKFREQWDTDRDGEISLAERNAAKIQIRRRIELRRNARFDAVDTGVDGIGAADGFLAPSEFFAIAAVAASDLANPGIAEKLFGHLDKNNDRKISRDEFLQSLDSVRPALTTTPQPKPHPAANLTQRQRRLSASIPPTSARGLHPCTIDPSLPGMVGMAQHGSLPRRAPPWLAVMLAGLAATPSPAELLYSTDFEAFTIGPDHWVGTEGWLGNSTGVGAHGIDHDQVVALGKTAYLGFNQPTDTLVSVYKRLDHDPVARQTARIQIDTLLGIEDSTNGHRDSFFISIYNIDGWFLGAVRFANEIPSFGVWRLDGPNQYDTGVEFIHGELHLLFIEIDLQNNLWRADLDGIPLFAGRQFTATGQARNLGVARRRVAARRPLHRQLRQQLDAPRRLQRVGHPLRRKPVRRRHHRTKPVRPGRPHLDRRTRLDLSDGILRRP